MDDLPVDIISNILARLPVKPVLRLKIVCKSWLFLITSAPFAAFHLRHHPLSSNRLLIATDKSSNLYSIDIDSPDSSTATLLPIKLPLDSTKIAGSCNGILCLRDNSKNESIVLLNPCTQEYKVVGDLGFAYGNYLGVGYDSGNNEHKLVLLSYHSKTLPRKDDGVTEICQYCVTRIYSLKTNSWSTIHDSGPSNSDFGCHKCYGFGGGALIGNHLLQWVFRSICPERFPDTIGCFDVCENRWKVVAPPTFSEGESDSLDNESDPFDHTYYVRNDVYIPRLFTVGVLDECLCLVTNNRVRTDVFDVWVMKEYGVAESWVKLLGVADSLVTVSNTDCPIAWSRDGRELLVMKICDLGRKAKLGWYDVGEKTLRKASSGLDEVPDYWSMMVFRESLAKVSGDVQIDAEAEQLQG